MTSTLQNIGGTRVNAHGAIRFELGGQSNCQCANIQYQCQYPIGNIGSGNWQQFHIGYSLRHLPKHISWSAVKVEMTVEAPSGKDRQFFRVDFGE
jgi:hypothetical protein